jgi:peptidoglycan hydrolase-like protein with peptidoglycan-binding domain
VRKAVRSKRAVRGGEKDFGLLRGAFGAAARCILRRPLDSAAIFVAAIAGLVILVNALFLQFGRHPAPMLRAHARPAAIGESTGAFERMIPRARPVALTRSATPAAPAMPTVPRTQGEIVTLIQQELAARGFYDAAPDGLWGPKTDAAVRAFAQRAGVSAPVEPGEALLSAIKRSPIKAAPAVASASPAALPADTLSPADAALPSPRLMAVQRALADFGYGQINPTGIEDAPTRAAITAFERVRNLPPTGRMSDQLVRELSVMTGRPLE